MLTRINKICPFVDLLSISLEFLSSESLSNASEAHIYWYIHFEAMDLIWKMKTLSYKHNADWISTKYFIAL